MPQAESWFHQAQNGKKIEIAKDSIITMQKEQIAQTKSREQNYLSQIDILKQQNEIDKPTIWQSKYFIVGYIVITAIIAFYLGSL